MIPPQYPENEFERQIAVEKYQLLDTLPEESFDNITALMALVCEAPISLVSLLDRERNFLKSHHGIPFNESPREISFCGHAINSDDQIMIVEDARKDERFHDNPLVSEHQAVFYAGAPLVDPDGYRLGTLCVYDTKPRTLTSQQQEALIAMAQQVIRLFEAHYKNLKLEKLQKTLEQRNDNLEKFAGVVSHDLKSPLAQITALTQLIEQDNQANLDEETRQYLEYIKESSDTLRDYIDGVLRFYKTDEALKQAHSWEKSEAYFKDLLGLFRADESVHFELDVVPSKLHMNKAALTQIFVNLIANAIKHNDKEQAVITIRCRELEKAYRFEVSDNGPGIPEESQEAVFELFTALQSTDKFGRTSTGIGLATVKKVIDSLKGSIQLESENGNGTTFRFELPM
ncbi:ATPase [Gilvibacter sp. SZ-19]|uniref:sensor histidine kinase n=1 Tax=Gilvibacter sp. SZ-19 TaxID=754429 RepID=UPI000B3C4A60|nr:GAF domain-containing sensor histidine kinase [Gilvibacter sp. SZ-19]ARV12717.1 ATPase [Gilvibacter sp. SZ-19]